MSFDELRVRMDTYGAASLSTSDLVSLSGRMAGGRADGLIKGFEGLAGLARADVSHLWASGVSVKSASALVAAFELGRRAAAAETAAAGGEGLFGENETAAAGGEGLFGENGTSVALVVDAVGREMSALLADAMSESMWVVMLDIRNKIRGKVQLYAGTCDQLVAKTGEILGAVVRRGYPRFILIHNHPSGSLDPSGADISFTERVVKAAESLDVECLDHVVVGRNDFNDFFSMRDNGLVDFKGDFGRVAKARLQDTG